MKRLVIHMGPHKTGTTYIQKKLHENRHVLKGSGICYPDAYYLFFGHHYLLNALNGGEGSASISENFSLSKSSGSDILISSENFISLSRKGLLKLKDVFEGYELRFIYYIRRPSLRLLSRWHEEVKQGGVVSVDNYFVNHLFKPMQSVEVNVFRHVDMVANLFGRGAVRLVDYDTAVTENNMLGSLFSAMDRETVVSDVREDVNKMVDLSEIEIIRFLNFSASRHGLLKGSNVRGAFYYVYGEHSEKIESLKRGIEKYSYEVGLGDAGFDKAVYNMLTSEYSDVLLNGPSVVQEKVKAIPSSNWMMEPELMQVVAEISHSVLERLKNGVV